MNSPSTIKADAAARRPYLALRAHGEVFAGSQGTPALMMFAPGGTHLVNLGMGEASSASVWLRVDQSTAQVLNAKLAENNAAEAPQRTLFDKEHEGKEAMAWPTGFVWRDQPKPGVYATVEWSALGASYVEGKVMRAFSPQFFSDAALPKRKDVKRGKHYDIPAGKRGSEENPARIMDLDFPYAGTLTNNPAFREISPLWARDAGRPEKRASETTHMMTNEEKTNLQARLKALETEQPELRATAKADENDAAAAQLLKDNETEIESIKAKLELAELKARTINLEAAVLEQREKDADAAVKAAVKRGAIAVKDDALQAKWKKICIEDPDKGLELLATLKGSPALERPRITIGQVQIVREDTLDVLKAYAAEKNPKKKAALYAKELSKRISDKEEIPLAATNTLGTVAPEIVVQRTLELLHLEFPALKQISTDFSDEPVKFNAEINSRIVSIPGVSSYSTSTGYATENTTTVDVPVTIDQHKSCQVGFNANELASTSRKLFDEQAPAMAYALAKDLVDAVYALITAAIFTNTATTEALVNMDRTTVLDLGLALNGRGVPKFGRTLLLSSAYYAKLLADSAIVSLATFQRPEIITGSKLPNVNDFDLVDAVNLPTTGNLTGFAMSRSALVLATRLPNDYADGDATGGGTVQTIMDSNSGFSVMLVTYVNHQLGAKYRRLAWMYGCAKGQMNAGQRLISA